ncbi:MAG: hypothetical protein J6B54_01245 [Clostridia bacterium]|nr:hypothetical protein [Clostridia bacterium]
MDPKFLEELQKLKEEKNASQEKIDLGQFAIPDFDDVEVPDDDLGAKTEAEIAGGTIKFERVTPDTKPQTPPSPGGRRGKNPTRPVIDEKTRKRRAKTRKTILISLSSSLAVIGILLVVFFGVRNANMKNYTYPYLGMGIAIDNGENQYSFFGNLKEITQYGTIGQVEAIAEFKNGNCVKETAYTPEGDVKYYYSHEYDGKTRILSSYYEDGQMVTSVKYTESENGTIQAETTYYLEEARVETAILTLTEAGDVALAEYYSGTLLTHKKKYDGTLVTEETAYKEDGATVLSRITYEYNAKKQLLTRTEYDANNAIQGRTSNQYNEKNLLTKTIYYDGNAEIIEYETFNYDLNNNPIKQVKYTGDGTMKYQILKVFNDKGRVTKETSLKTDGSIDYCYGYDYDKDGYVSKSIVYNTENAVLVDRYTLYTRNKIGSVTRSDTYNSSNVLIEKTSFNEFGFATSSSKFNDNGILILEQKTKYDGKQRINQREETIFDDRGSKLSYLNEQLNEKGLVTVRIIENVTEATYEQFLFVYHNDGWKLQETLFDKSGKTICDKIFDQEQNVLSESLFEDGKQITYNEYTYDTKGQILLKTSLDIATGTHRKYHHTYDEKNILVSVLETDFSDVPLRLDMLNEKGLVSIRTNYDEIGEEKDYYRYEYDEMDRVIVSEYYMPDGSLIEKTVYYYRENGEYDYTVYDQFGLVIEDTRFPELNSDLEDDKPTADDEDQENS